MMNILSWMIGVWMNNHFVRDSNCNIVYLLSPKSSQGMTNNVGLTFNVAETIMQFTISIEKDNQN